jgi:hypothetical protein
MNSKGCGRNQSWYILRRHTGICMEGLRNPGKSVSGSRFKLSRPEHYSFRLLARDVAHDKQRLFSYAP